MRKYTPKSAALAVIRLLILFVCIAVTVAARIYLVSFKIIMIAVICLFWGLGLLFGLLILPYYFRRTVIYISGSEISIHTGLIFYKREFMKMSAVQYVTRLSFPLSSITGFNFVLIRGLGGTIILPFLKSIDCNEIMELLHVKIAER